MTERLVQRIYFLFSALKSSFFELQVSLPNGLKIAELPFFIIAFDFRESEGASLKFMDLFLRLNLFARERFYT